jgi:hypothetical protein
MRKTRLSEIPKYLPDVACQAASAVCAVGRVEVVLCQIQHLAKMLPSNRIESTRRICEEKGLLPGQVRVLWFGEKLQLFVVVGEIEKQREVLDARHPCT